MTTYTMKNARGGWWHDERLGRLKRVVLSDPDSTAILADGSTLTLTVTRTRFQRREFRAAVADGTEIGYCKEADQRRGGPIRWDHIDYDVDLRRDTWGGWYRLTRDGEEVAEFMHTTFRGHIKIKTPDSTMSVGTDEPASLLVFVAWITFCLEPPSSD